MTNTNAQYCPVCSYALKKTDTECGRCGEVLQKITEPVETLRQAPADAQSLTGYSIEAIGKVADVEVAGSPDIHFANGQPVKEGSTKRARDDDQRSMRMLQRELRDLNERIARMDAEKRMTSMLDGNAFRQEQAAEGAVVTEEVKRYSKSDRYFSSLVKRHVTAMKEAGRGATEGSLNAETLYHHFIDGSIVKPGVFDRSITLFVGPPGSLKSTMAAVTIAGMAKASGGRALYLTLDDRKSKFELRTRELNLQKESEIIAVADKRDIRRGSNDIQSNWRASLMEYVRRQLSRGKFRFIVLDNLNALSTLLSTDRERRATFALFNWIRDLGLTAVAVMEGEYSKVLRSKRPEIYLADGIVQFHRIDRGNGESVPMFRVLKMRGAEIDCRYYSLQLNSGSLKFVPAVAM